MNLSQYDTINNDKNPLYDPSDGVCEQAPPLDELYPDGSVTKKYPRAALDSYGQDQAKTERQGDFILKPNGLFIEETNAAGEKEQFFICSKLEVVAKVRDENSDSWGRLLRFKDPSGISHEWSVPMRMLAGDATELRANLLDMGLVITPAKKRNVLGSYIQLWATKRFMTAVEMTGWQKNSFVLLDRIIGQDSDLVFQTESIRAQTFGQAGTVEEWRDNVGSLCVDNSRLIFSVCAAFASPLLNLIGEAGGGFQWTESSSTGKTTVLRAACSVCGSWDYKITWRTTDNGLEGIAETRNDALLILDELSEVDPRVAGKIAYMLANGQGKQRANRRGGARPAKRWRLLFLSSGEVSLSDHMTESGGKVKAGQEVRMVDIPGDAGAGHGCFEDLHGFRSGSEFSDKITEVTGQYHGTPLLRFLEEIIEIGIADVAAYVKANVEDVAHDFCHPDAEGQVRRVAKRFALIGVAGEIASGITGWENGTAIKAAKRCFDDWVKARGGHRNREQEAIKRKLFAFIEKHGQSRFQDMDWSAHSTVNNRAGFIKTTGDVSDYYLLPSTMQEIYQGDNLNRALAILTEEKIIYCDRDGKKSISRKLPGLGSTRCYHIPGVPS